MEATTDLDRLIERRASKEPDPDELEPSYAESVRRYREKQRREHLWQKLRFHERMLANHTKAFQQILDRHKKGVAKCEAMLGVVNQTNERKEA